MTTGIVFSRDRAAQLDLLLRSIQKNLPFITRIDVLWRATDKDYKKAYKQCHKEHKGFAQFWREQHFQYQVTDLVCRAGLTMAFFCDDDIAYRKNDLDPHLILHHNPDILTHSMRLGKNTIVCYPMRRIQQQPPWLPGLKLNTWEWRKADGDFGYPGSLDGNVFRRDQVHSLITGDFFNPNTLEDVLVKNCRQYHLPLMSCYERSVVFGNPANRVNETHISNRFGEFHYSSVDELNTRYLEGERLKPKIPLNMVRGAHQEVQLR